jgi:hypothetical protein
LWPKCSNESRKKAYRKPGDLLINRQRQPKKKVKLTLSQGMLKKGDDVVDDDDDDKVRTSVS